MQLSTGGFFLGGGGEVVMSDELVREGLGADLRGGCFFLDVLGLGDGRWEQGAGSREEGGGRRDGKWGTGKRIGMERSWIAKAMKRLWLVGQGGVSLEY